MLYAIYKDGKNISAEPLDTAPLGTKAELQRLIDGGAKIVFTKRKLTKKGKGIIDDFTADEIAEGFVHLHFRAKHELLFAAENKNRRAEALKYYANELYPLIKALQ